jgi:hypothetical protein
MVTQVSLSNAPGRFVKGGIGDNPPQEAPEAFEQAAIDVSKS